VAQPPPCCQIEGLLQLFALDNAAVKAAWRLQSTEKALSSTGSAPEPAGGAYSAPQTPLLVLPSPRTPLRYRPFGPQSLARPCGLPTAKSVDPLALFRQLAHWLAASIIWMQGWWVSVCTYEIVLDVRGVDLSDELVEFLRILNEADTAVNVVLEAVDM